MTRLTDLTQPELDVLLLLAQARETNVVSLAADLWRTTPDWQAYDPYPLITYILDSLSSRGLATFRLRHGDLPQNVRLTPKGWALAGYPNRTVEVGSSGRHERQSAHPGDRTDYVNLAGHTFGGPIEVEDFPTHRAHYPDHIHMYGDPIMANQQTQTKGDDMTRSYLRVTPEIEARVLHAREVVGVASYADIAEVAGLPERTIKYVLVDLPRLRRINAGEDKAAKSLKERCLVAITDIGTIKDVAELRRIVGMADSEHDVMHVLHSLHTQGRIDFDERGNGMGTATVVNIRLHKKGQKVRLRPDPEAVQEIPTQPLPVISRQQEEQAISARVQAEAESAGYPLLDALIEREGKRLSEDNKAFKYLEAAEAIKDIDPEAYSMLVTKAESNIPFPSPIEAEYLKYVKDHE